MIRINLLPVKRKKKRKPLPAFAILGVVVTLIACAALAYLFFFFDSRLSEAKATFETNKQRIADLKNKIKDVENFEKLNRDTDQKNKTIEQLRKNQNVPVMLLDELSRHLPKGVWLNSLKVAGAGGTVDGYAFTNSEVVSYVDNLKGSKVLTDIYLQESKQAEVDKIPLYKFVLTFKVGM